MCLHIQQHFFQSQIQIWWGQSCGGRGGQIAFTAYLSFDPIKVLQRTWEKPKALKCSVKMRKIAVKDSVLDFIWKYITIPSYRVVMINWKASCIKGKRYKTLNCHSCLCASRWMVLFLEVVCLKTGNVATSLQTPLRPLPLGRET